MKKSGDISLNHVDRGYAFAHLRTGAVGIQVRILHPETKLPDKIIIHPLNAAIPEQKIIVEEKIELSIKDTEKEEKTKQNTKEKPKKRASKKVEQEDGNSKEE